MIQEQVLVALKALGFKPEQMDDTGYRFEYMGLILLYVVEDEDTRCLTFMAPDIFRINENNVENVSKAMQTLSRRMRYTKPIVMFDDRVWINYQHYLGENDPTPDLLEHIIRLIEVSVHNFKKIYYDGDDNAH